MKIGLVSPYTLTYGGVQEHVRALYQNFTSRGHDVRIIAPRLGRENPQKDVIFIGRAFYSENTTGTGSYHTLGFHYGPIVEEVLEREKFDVLHFHEPMLPTISWFLLTYSKSLNIITAHRAQKFSPEEKALYRFLKPLLLPLLAKKVHGRIAVSQAAYKFTRRYLPGECTIIPNGVDPTRFCPRGKRLPQFQDGKINILYVGRLEPRKGLIYLLRTLLLLGDDRLRLIIVGDGPLKKEYQRFIQKKRLANIFFAGEVAAQNLPSYYRSADIFCSPAPHGESFGIVLLEAMASGLPVVAFANLGYRELLSDYPSKKLIPLPKDVEGLARALKILAKDKNLRKKLGLWGREKAKKYSWKKISGEVLDYYREIQSHHRRGNGLISTTIKATSLPRFIKDLAIALIEPY